jgi:hypothetical protein
LRPVPTTFHAGSVEGEFFFRHNPLKSPDSAKGMAII